MKTQVIIFDKPEPKKHSIRFDTSDPDPAVTSVYVSKAHLGQPYPQKIKITIEEA